MAGDLIDDDDRGTSPDYFTPCSGSRCCSLGVVCSHDVETSELGGDFAPERVRAFAVCDYASYGIEGIAYDGGNLAIVWE